MFAHFFPTQVVDTEEVTKSGSLLPLGKNRQSKIGDQRCDRITSKVWEVLFRKSAIAQLGARISKWKCYVLFFYVVEV